MGRRATQIYEFGGKSGGERIRTAALFKLVPAILVCARKSVKKNFATVVAHFEFLMASSLVDGVIPSLTTVCPVKRFVATLRRGRREQRHFALAERL